MPRIAHHPRLLALLAAATALVAAPLLGGESKPADPTLEIRVEGDDGASVRLSLSTGWLAGLIDEIHIECKTESDARTRETMASLDAAGEGAVREYVEDDGDRVVARRTRGQLVLETRERDGGRATVEMPWAAARCLMLGIEPDGDLGRRIASGEARLRLDVRDHGDRVRVRLE